MIRVMAVMKYHALRSFFFKEKKRTCFQVSNNSFVSSSSTVSERESRHSYCQSSRMLLQDLLI